VQIPSFTWPEAFADLKYSGVIGGKESFHAKLRRSMQEPVPGCLGIDVCFRCRGRNPEGGLHLEKIMVNEILSYGLNHPGPEKQIFFDAGLSRLFCRWCELVCHADGFNASLTRSLYRYNCLQACPAGRPGEKCSNPLLHTTGSRYPCRFCTL